MEKINNRIYSAIYLSFLISIFSSLSAYFFWFTLDDAYITLRYSKHLAEGYGIVWNLGADPIEGYTSFLWMAIGSIPHAIGLPPVAFMKILGIVSTVLTIIIIYEYGRFRSINQWILVVGTAQIAVSPAIAVLSVQGMETTTAMLLVLFTTIGALEVIRKYRTKWAILMNVALFGGMLARPDLVVFGVFLEAGLAGLFYQQNRLSDLKSLFLNGFLLVFLPGVVYMLSRYWYFGHLFPNPFYIKSGFSLLGPLQIFEFVMLLIGPLLFVTLVVSVQHAKVRKALIKMSPLCLAIISFLSLYIFITPIQGYLYRFLITVFPTALLILMLALNKSKLTIDNFSLNSSSVARVALVCLLISGLFVYPLFTAPESISQTDKRTQGDRVVMGQALESLENQDYQMFVSESGALPYYSEWEAVDQLGLNSEEIAHKGLTQQLLSDYDPDLIMHLASQGASTPSQSSVRDAYLDNSSYALVAVVHKQNADRTNVHPNNVHAYYVDTESEGYRDIACTIVSQDLEYANKSLFAEQTGLNIQVSNITASDCK